MNGPHWHGGGRSKGTAVLPLVATPASPSIHHLCPPSISQHLRVSMARAKFPHPALAHFRYLPRAAVRTSGKDQREPAASYVALWARASWAGRLGVGSLPCGEMLLQPSVTSLPSVFPVQSPSGPPHTLFFYALVASQIFCVNATMETNQFNSSLCRDNVVAAQIPATLTEI